MIAYAKLGAILALVLLLFGGGYYFGGLPGKAALERVQQAQAENTAKAVLAERASAAVELARVNGILKGYEDEALKPVDPTIAERVLYRACPASGPLPSGSPHPASPGSASQEPRSDPSLERLLQTVIDSCTQDANELTALQAAWPR